jgi:hypothetical protein
MEKMRYCARHVRPSVTSQTDEKMRSITRTAVSTKLIFFNILNLIENSASVSSSCNFNDCGYCREMTAAAILSYPKHRKHLYEINVRRLLHGIGIKIKFMPLTEAELVLVKNEVTTTKLHDTVQKYSSPYDSTEKIIRNISIK